MEGSEKCRNDDIIHLGEGVYLVSGRVIAVRTDDIDPSSDAGRAELMHYATTLFTGKFDRERWPGVTAAILYPKVASVHGPMHALATCHFNSLPGSVRARLREEFPDHADEI